MGRLCLLRGDGVSYAVKEIFHTLQGEGAHTGRAAVFLRFAGCNLWSGREADRAKGPGACSVFCDTDFVGTDGRGGGRYSAAALVGAALRTWVWGAGRPLVVCTGGEPLLQLDAALVEALHAVGFEVAVETNGTIAAPSVDWLCVSPKAGGELVQRMGHELKLLFPQPGAEPERFEALPFERFSLQPIDNADREQNTRAAVAYCLAHPKWRLSLQTHKFLGIP